VPSFIGRTKTCAQSRSERTENGMKTYYGRVERSVNEVVEFWTGVDVMGTDMSQDITLKKVVFLI